MKIESLKIDDLNNLGRILKNKKTAKDELRTFDIVKSDNNFFMFFNKDDILNKKYIDDDFLNIEHIKRTNSGVFVGYDKDEFYFYYTLAFNNDLTHVMFHQYDISEIYLADEITYNYFNNKKLLYFHNLTKKYLEDTIKYHNYTEIKL